MWWEEGNEMGRGKVQGEQEPKQNKQKVGVSWGQQQQEEQEQSGGKQTKGVSVLFVSLLFLS